MISILIMGWRSFADILSREKKRSAGAGGAMPERRA